MLQLLIHQWKEYQRSTFWQKSLIVNILLGILGIYLLLNILVVGYFADNIIREIYKSGDVVVIYTGFLFYYFAFDLILRFLVQKLPILSIQPYLTLPIKKSTLLHYPLVKSLASFLNVVALLLILPFFVKVICVTHTISFCLAWIITVVSFIVTNNFLNFSIKKYFSKRPSIILILLPVVGTLIYLDISKTILISHYFTTSLFYIAGSKWLFIIPIIVSALAYYLGYSILKRNAYIEDRQIGLRRNSGTFSFLSRYGETGLLMEIELKMIFRNQRPKSMLFIGLIYLGYGYLFYHNRSYNSDLILVFFGILMTSIFAIIYGQFSFSWEASFFDYYLANKISPSGYIRSKYLLFAVSSTLSYLVTLPYAFLNPKIVFINTAMLFYNIGISSVFILFFSTYNATRIDLGRSQFMNYQGLSYVQYLNMIPVMVFPVLIQLMFNWYANPQYGIYLIGLLGLIGILFNKYLVQLVTNQFKRRRYTMATDFKHF